MPHYYAHRVFGEQVWNALPQTLRLRLGPAYPTFRLGLYGPDPLFFHSPRQTDPVVMEGHAQHRLPPAEVLEAFRGHGKDLNALAYAAGWLCHYMLDTACHPIVLSASGSNSLRHAAVELALDRRLMEKYPLPKEGKFPAAAFDAAAIPCQQATAEQFQAALKGFYRFSYTTANLYKSNGNGALQAKLIAKLRHTAPICAGMVTRLIDCLEGDKPLDWLPAQDFYGRKT